MWMIDARHLGMLLARGERLCTFLIRLWSWVTRSEGFALA